MGNWISLFQTLGSGGATSFQDFEDEKRLRQYIQIINNVITENLGEKDIYGLERLLYVLQGHTLKLHFMPFAGTVIISMNPQYSGGSDNLYRFMANIITQITNETLRGLLDKSNIENIKHIRDDLERLKTYYNPDNNLPLYDVLSSERIMNLPEWKQTRASIIQLLNRYINTINEFIAQSGQQAGRRRSSTKKRSSPKRKRSSPKRN
jgi:hypothetical protein